MSDFEKINEVDLNKVAGGNDGMGSSGNDNWVCAEPCVRTGYLAIRSYPSYDDSNILDEIYPGSVFTVNTYRWSGNYVWADYRGVQGWVNSDYISIL